VTPGHFGGMVAKDVAKQLLTPKVRPKSVRPKSACNSRACGLYWLLFTFRIS
jgi:hypothetical protein